MEHTELRLCRSCDLLVELPSYHHGYKCTCPRCGAVLRSGTIYSMERLAVVGLAALLLLLSSIFVPFMSVEAFSIYQGMSLASIFTVLRADWSILLYIFLLFTFVMPLLMLLIIMAAGFFKYRPGRLAAEVYAVCHRFCMVDVFVLGVMVSLVKLVGLADVGFYEGFWCSMLFALLMVWLWSKCYPERIWDLVMKPGFDVKTCRPGVIGRKQSLLLCRHCGMVYRADQHDRCPRCGGRAEYRESGCFSRAVALLLAAAILYLPANLYPIMVTSYLGASTSSNIIDGVISMWEMNSYFVSLVILFASIFIPVLKILCLSYLLFEIKHPLQTRNLLLTRIYRVVAFIGKWSMIDVFVVIIMTSIVRMSGLLTIDPGFAIICFCAVVLITMFAAEGFDERLIWDRNEQ